MSAVPPAGSGDKLQTISLSPLTQLPEGDDADRIEIARDQLLVTEIPVASSGPELNRRRVYASSSPAIEGLAEVETSRDRSFVASTLNGVDTPQWPFWSSACICTPGCGWCTVIWLVHEPFTKLLITGGELGRRPEEYSSTN